MGFERTEFGIDSGRLPVDQRGLSVDGRHAVCRLGELFTDHLYVATGFNAWGISNGTVADGPLRLDQRPGQSLGPGVRCHPGEAAGRRKSFISENIGTGAELVMVRYLQGERRSLDELPVGEAAIVKPNGQRAAVFRDESGRVHGLRRLHPHGVRAGQIPRPHLGLSMSPCFALDGSVIHGPATTSLERIPVP